MNDLHTRADTLDETYSNFTKLSGLEGYASVHKFEIETEDTYEVICVCGNAYCRYPKWLLKPDKNKATLSTLL